MAAQPDEWLLRIRGGRLVNAGIGISLWRLPGDVVVRFTSTVQRVGFSVEALSQEHLPMLIEGFALWAVAPEGDGPFHAFSRLGIANLDHPPPALRSHKHLLTSPQHHAFQALLGAEVQRHSVTLRMDQILLEQSALVGGLTDRLRSLAASLGIRIEQVEILHVRPTDASLLRDLSAAEDQKVREQAATVRLATAERLKQREIESQTTIAREAANSRRDREAHEAQTALELEQERAKLLEAQDAARQQQMEYERLLQLAQLEADRTIKARQQEIEVEARLANESAALRVSEARLHREQVELAAQLEATRGEAEAQRDAMQFVASAEEEKSQVVRNHELSKLITERVSQVLAAWRVSDARWVSVGADSPVGSIASIVAGVREMLVYSCASDAGSKGARLK